MQFVAEESKEFKKLRAQDPEAKRPKRDASVLTDAQITEFETALNNMLPQNEYEQGWLDMVQTFYKAPNGKDFLASLANPANNLRAIIPYTDGYGITKGYNLNFLVFIKYNDQTERYSVSRHVVGQEKKVKPDNAERPKTDGAARPKTTAKQPNTNKQQNTNKQPNATKQVKNNSSYAAVVDGSATVQAEQPAAQPAAQPEEQRVGEWGTAKDD